MAIESDQFLMNTQTVQDIGSAIVSDTLSLQLYVQSFWQRPKSTLHGEAGKDIPINDLPACLQDDFKNYELLQQSELGELLQKRQRIGQLLVEVSSLVDFQAQLSQLVHIDIYRANTCYNCGIIPDYLRTPNDTEPSESK